MGPLGALHRPLQRRQPSVDRPRTGVPGRLKPRRNRPGPRQHVARHPAARKAARRYQLSGGRAQPVAYRRRQLRPRAIPERLPRHRRGLLRQPESAGIRFRSRSRRQPRCHPPQLPRRRKGQHHARRRSGARRQRRADSTEGARDLPGQAPDQRPVHSAGAQPGGLPDRPLRPHPPAGDRPHTALLHLHGQFRRRPRHRHEDGAERPAATSQAPRQPAKCRTSTAPTTTSVPA